MANFFCSMLFAQSSNKAGGSTAQVRTGGWSESWYKTGAADDAKFALESLCLDRAKLLSNSAAIIGQRYRIVGGGSSTGNKQFPGSSGLKSDQPQSSLQLSCLGINVVNNRKWRIKGVPDDRIIEGEYLGSAQYDGALRSYFTTLGLLHFAFKARDLAADKAEIFTVLANGDVTCVTPLTVTGGTKLDALRIIGENGRAISGTFTVASFTDSTHFHLGDWPNEVGTGGFFRKRVTIYPEVDDASCNVVRATTAKVGRGFFQYRGRRSKAA